MATIVADVGGGNWTTGTTWVGGTAPTAADDAQIPVTAGNITIDSGAVCRSADFSTYTGTLTHTAAVTWTIGDATAGLGNIALKLVAGMTYTLGSATTSAISFVSTSATVQTVDFAGKTSGNVTYNASSNGSWQLTGTHVASGAGTDVTLTKGTLDTNGQTCTWDSFVSANSNVRTLTLGASSITLGGTSVAWDFSTSTNATLNANTSTITLSASAGAGQFSGGGLTYNNVVQTMVSGNVNFVINQSNTFANLTITGNAVKTSTTRFGGNQTITGTLTINGNSSTNRLLIRSTTIGTARTLTAATVAVTNSDFQDITGAGAGSWDLSAITGLSGDCEGNSGITFTTAQTNYWVGGTGNWSAVGEWANSSGGAGSSGRVPLPQDDIVFDANSFSAGSQTCTADMPRLGNDINWTGVTNTPAWAKTTSTSIFGSVTMISGMTNSGSSTLTFESRTPATFTSDSQTITNSVVVETFNTTFTLQDAYVSSSTITLQSGTLNFNNFSVTLLQFSTASSLSKTITLGNSTTSLTGTGTSFSASPSGLSVTATTGTIKFTNTTATARTFQGAGFTYGNFWHAGGAGGATLTVTGSNTFTDFKDDGSVAHSILFTAGTTTTVSTFTVSGNPSELITINSTTTATHALTKTGGGTISCDYLNIQHSVARPWSGASGADTWYAGANSVDNQADVTAGSGWIFTVPPEGSTWPGYIGGGFF